MSSSKKSGDCGRVCSNSAVTLVTYVTITVADLQLFPLQSPEIDGPFLQTTAGFTCSSGYGSLTNEVHVAAYFVCVCVYVACECLFLEWMY